MAAYQVYLWIDHTPKVIPYGGDGGLRPDGHANYGFTNLKGNLHLLDAIPELASDPSLKSLVEAINVEETGVFSVGCSSGEVREQKGYRYTGYIEFVFNAQSFVGEVQNYFPLFLHFDRLLFERRFSQSVRFGWEIQPARFLDANVGGFTCSVFVDTALSLSEEEAAKAWSAALEILKEFLGSIPNQRDDSIY